MISGSLWRVLKLVYWIWAEPGCQTVSDVFCRMLVVIKIGRGYYMIG